MPVLFLHGWGLGHRAYRRALRRLTARGCRVYAPAMPGFGGTADLPPRERSVAGYADWVADFLAEVGVDEPAFVLGHSFGGGVAIRLAHDHPELVRYLVLLNSVGTASDAVPGTIGNLRAVHRAAVVVGDRLRARAGADPRGSRHPAGGQRRVHAEPAREPVGGLGGGHHRPPGRPDRRAGRAGAAPPARVGAVQ